MQTLTDIKAILADAGLTPKKALGQNFLHDQNMIRKLVDASGVAADSLVLEVGPGTGALTEALLERGCELIAIELDDGLYQMNKLRLADTHSNQMTLIHGDALPKGQLNSRVAEAIRGREFTMVANLPYQVASPLMVRLALDESCLGQHVMIQREVAQRLRADVGTRDYSELTVMVRSVCDVSRISAVPAGCFWPQPKVVSELVSIVPRERPSAEILRQLESLCGVVFRQRRKQLGSLLSRDLEWPAGVSAQLRAEQLTVGQLIELAGIWSAHNDKASS